MFTTWGNTKKKAGVVKLGCFCAAARGTHCSDQTVCGSLTWWARGHDTTANQNTPNVTMTRKTQPIPLWLCACTLYTGNNDENFTTAFNIPPWIDYFYQVSSIKRKGKNPKYIETALLWMLPGRFCGCGHCSRSVQSSQTERAAMFLLDNECKLHQKYFSLFSRWFSQYVYMHERHRTRLRLTGFLCTGKYQTTACPQSGSVELMLQVMSINSM